MKPKTLKLLLTIFFLFSLIIISQEKTTQAQSPCAFPVFPGGREFPSNNVYIVPSQVAVGDVNNDGKSDIVTTSYDDRSNVVTGNITVYLGTGTGNFSSIRDFNADSYAYYLSLGDVNGDGNLDAIVSSHVVNGIRILLGDGAGNFSLFTRLPGNPRKIEVVDITRDGKADLLVSNGGTVSVIPGIGNGTFATPITTPINEGVATFAVDDFNRDGKIDFVTISSSRLSTWLGDGTGHFVMDWTSNQALGEIIKGNLNNDEYTDLAIGGDGKVTVFFGNGDGTFRISERYNTHGQGAGAITRIADLNRDGWNDIVKQNFGDDDVSILLGTGNGRFAQARNQPIGFRPKQFEIGDFNGDSYPDAVTISSTATPTSFLDTIRLTLGKGDGTFIAPINLGVDRNSTAFAVADINSDGKDDIVSANSLNQGVSQGISVFLGIGNFKFAPARIFASQKSFNFISVADFNNDGKLDIAGVGGSDGIILLGDGSGNFATAQTLTFGGSASFADFVGSSDFNGDGKIDLVVSDGNQNRILIFSGNGNGTFAPPTSYLIGDPIKRIAIGDFNRDGKPDLAIVLDTFLTIYSRVQIRLNQGDGTFPTATNNYNLGVSIHPRSVITNDFDGDGKLDFAVTTDRDPGSPGRVSIYKGRGDGSFIFTNAYSVGDTFPSDLIAKDFNSDGKVDIATVNNLLSNDISIFAGAGDGTFSLVQTIPIGVNPRMILAGNFNNDNSPDLLINSPGFSIARNTCNQAAETIETGTKYDFDGDSRADISVFRPSNGTWYLNRSTSGFSAVAFGSNGDLIAPADFDGDGKTDVAVFRPSNGTWYYLKSSDNSFAAVQFGQNGDLPRPADFDGDGKADINVFRPSNGAWYRLNSSNGSFSGAIFGQHGDQPLIADFDGDAKSDIAVFRPSAGAFYWLESATGNFKAIGFGFGTDIPTIGDFDGDGKTDIAVFRQSNGSWYRYNSSNGAFFGVAFGQNGDIPVTADYDGDGKADIAIFRPSNGAWYYLNSSNGSFVGQIFGFGTDKPTPAAFQ